MAKDDAAADETKKDAAKGEASAEGAEGAAEGEAGAGKKSKKKILIIGVLALVVLLGAVAGAYFGGLFGGGEEHAENPAHAEAEKPVFYTLPQFLVNLNTGTKATSFLKTTVILEVPKQEDIPLIEANLPRLVDAVNTYLRELRASDLSGSAGIQRLREELLIRANKALAPVKVNDVLFKEIVVQ
jgi:flagellar FliL protein